MTEHDELIEQIAFKYCTIYEDTDDGRHTVISNAMREFADTINKPIDPKLPCDLVVGNTTFKKGVSVSTAQGAITRMSEEVHRLWKQYEPTSGGKAGLLLADVFSAPIEERK